MLISFNLTLNNRCPLHSDKPTTNTPRRDDGEMYDEIEVGQMKEELMCVCARVCVRVQMLALM